MKNKKLLKAVVMLSLATTLAVPFNTLADKQGIRIGGRDRFEVAINVANKFSNSKSCIVLNYLAYSDSISSSEIAKGDMPIYYTKADSIDSNTLKDIRNKGYKNVFIIGGEKSVSKDVENELAKTSKVTRVSGQNRYDVNYKTLDKNKENLIVVSGENFADGLVSSTLAQIKNATIAITPSNEVHERLNQYLNVNKNLKNIYIVGGEKSITKSVENELSKYANVQRISGSNRYETSEKLAKEISDSKYIVVSGENFADNLVAGSLARRDKRAVVLSPRIDFSPMVRDISKNKDFIVIGGNNSIDESIFDKELDAGKIETKKVKVTEIIQYTTKEEKDSTLKQGERRTKQQGKDGEKEVVYEETFKNGVVISKKKVSEKTIKAPVDEIILVGTKVDPKNPEVTKRRTVKETIKYATKEEKDSTLKQGERRTKQQGKDGEKEVVYEETFKNGVVISKKKVSEKTIKAPVDEIILVGTKVDPKKEPEVTKRKIVKRTIEYTTKIEKDPTLKQGERRTKQQGKDGEKEVVYEIRYKDGVAISEKIISENITKTPVDEIILVGTKVEQQDKIEVKTITEYEDIAFNTEKQYDEYLDKGKTEIIQKGEKGKREIVYEVEYKNGKEIKRTKKYFRILKKPITEIIKVGTNEDKKIIEPIPTTDGELINYYNVDYNEPLSQKEQEIMDELNRVRKENGLNELKLSKTLTRTARIHARDASLKGEITHAWTPKLLELSEDIKFKKRQLGSETTWAVNWDDDAKYIIQGFMDSSEHKKILLAEDNVYVGVARYDSKFDRDNNGKVDPMSMIFIRVYGEDEFNELDYIPD